jgi:hypothetical protein
MKQLIFLFLVAIAFQFLACKKWSGEGKTTVEGQVIDITTQEPVPFAVIRIDAADKDAAYGGYNKFIKEETADAHGNFSFSFEAESNLSYSLSGGIKNKYYTAEEVLPRSAHKNKDLKVKLQPYGWVKVKLINEPPLDVAEIVSQYYHNYTFVNMLIKNDTTTFLQVDGNKPTIIYYWIRPNGNTQLAFSPSIFAPALDTTELIIKY